MENGATKFVLLVVKIVDAVQRKRDSCYVIREWTLNLTVLLQNFTADYPPKIVLVALHSPSAHESRITYHVLSIYFAQYEID